MSAGWTLVAVGLSLVGIWVFGIAWVVACWKEDNK